jgi:acetate kinase
MKILALNPGGNSLKAEVVECHTGQRYAFEGHTLLSISIEGIGEASKISILRGKETIATEAIQAESYEQAADSFLRWWGDRSHTITSSGGNLRNKIGAVAGTISHRCGRNSRRTRRARVR